VALELEKNAAIIVCDRGYLKHQRSWRDRVARKSSCSVVQVETDVVVPLGAVSSKAEYAARTIRPKIQKHLDDYLIELKPIKVQHATLNISLDGLDLKQPTAILALLNIDRSVPAVTSFFKGGTSRAKKNLRLLYPVVVEKLPKKSQPAPDRRHFAYEHVSACRSDLSTLSGAKNQQSGSFSGFGQGGFFGRTHCAAGIGRQLRLLQSGL
jgi:deoxyribodipyrimidine photo-lyase